MKKSKLSSPTSIKKSTSKTDTKSILSTKATSKKIITTDSFDYRKSEFKGSFIFDLKKNYKRRVKEPICLQRKFFRTIKLHRTPDSRRTIQPELSTERIRPYTPSQESFRKFNRESPNFNYISNVGYNPSPRRTPLSLRTSFSSNFTEQTSRTHRETPFEKYTTTTQIYSLPGGVKRNAKEIRDDERILRKFRGLISARECYKRKVQNEHNTNIACLPGCRLNYYRTLFRRYNGKKNEGGRNILEWNQTINNLTINRTLSTQNYSNIRTGKRMVSPETFNNKNAFGRQPLTALASPRRYHNESHFTLG